MRDYNRRVQSVPSNVIASMFHFEEEEFFEVEEALRGDEGVPKVSFEAGCARRVVRQPVRAVDGSAGDAPRGDAAAAGAAARRPRRPTNPPADALS